MVCVESVKKDNRRSYEGQYPTKLVIMYLVIKKRILEFYFVLNQYSVKLLFRN